MVCKQVWIFPVLLFILIPLTFVITYIIAVFEKHVEPVFPYISDTGAIPPESCIFGQLLNIGALFGGITVYLRHRQVVEFYRQARQSNKCILRTSLAFLWVGYFTCLGLSLVANFQETSVIVVHLVGAFMAFGLGLIYGFGQTVLTYMIDKIFVGIWMAHFRLTICLLGTVLFILMQVKGFVSNSTGSSSNCNSTVPYKIDHAQNLNGTAYDWYLVSAFSEWGFALCSITFFCTFAAEFRKSTLIPPKMLLNIGEHEFPRDRRVSKTKRNSYDDRRQRDDYNRRMNAFPEIRVPPPNTTTGTNRSKTKQHHYHSSDEIYNRNEPNYGSNDASGLPIVYKPAPNKRNVR